MKSKFKKGTSVNKGIQKVKKSFVTHTVLTLIDCLLVSTMNN